MLVFFLQLQCCFWIKAKLKNTTSPKKFNSINQVMMASPKKFNSINQVMMALPKKFNSTKIRELMAYVWWAVNDYLASDVLVSCWHSLKEGRVCFGSGVWGSCHSVLSQLGRRMNASLLTFSEKLKHAFSPKENICPTTLRALPDVTILSVTEPSSHLPPQVSEELCGWKVSLGSPEW